MEMKEAKKILADDEVQKILKATYMVPRSPIEVSEIYGIPIANCYRKIKVLEDAGILKAVDVKKDFRGRRTTYYRAQMENAYVTYGDGTMRIRFETLMHMSSVLRQRIMSA